MASGDLDTEAFDPGTILNQGVITRPLPDHSFGQSMPEKTLLITGLARSGTSMIAALLLEAGVWQGDHVYQPINEDAEITQMLRARDFRRLDALIERQNAQRPLWGFKMPDLHLYLQHDELQRFRNPHLIVIFRDPVAVAMRNVLSEQADDMQSMLDSTSAMHAITQFVRASGLPFLLLSYEKTLVFPQVVLRSILEFCGIQPDDEMCGRALAHMQPNRAEYVLTAKRAFEGYLEGVSDGRLCGWARHVGLLTPVLLDLLVDDALVATIQASDFRGDLLAAGIGNGNHAFVFDLSALHLGDDAVIRVRVNQRTYELPNSGKKLGELRVVRAADP